MAKINLFLVCIHTKDISLLARKKTLYINLISVQQGHVYTPHKEMEKLRIHTQCSFFTSLVTCNSETSKKFVCFIDFILAFTKYFISLLFCMVFKIILIIIAFLYSNFHSIFTFVLRTHKHTHVATLVQDLPLII